jgi:hypothetical protein
VHRLRRACEREVTALLAEGVPPERIALAARDADWRWLPCLEAPPFEVRQARHPGIDEIAQRLLHAVALEGVRCLDDGTVEGPAEADVGSVAGIGYPRWTGGVLSHIETVGLVRFVGEADRLARTHGARFEPPPSLRERAHAGRKFHDTVTLEIRS